VEEWLSRLEDNREAGSIGRNGLPGVQRRGQTEGKVRKNSGGGSRRKSSPGYLKREQKLQSEGHEKKNEVTPAVRGQTSVTCKRLLTPGKKSPNKMILLKRGRKKVLGRRTAGGKKT